MANDNKASLWLRWTFANAIGELFGLGGTFAVAAYILTRLGNRTGLWVVVISFLVAVASGIIEATIVGIAQWWAMKPWFKKITRFAWWKATLVGALIAYVLGYLPSTLMSLGEQAGDAAMMEPAQWLVLLLAAGMGAVGGVVLSFAQWIVLREQVVRAGWWIPANMIAWMVGMPVIFWGIDAAQKGQPLWQSLLLLAGTLTLCGIVVGAIHGVALVRIAVLNPTRSNG